MIARLRFRSLKHVHGCTIDQQWLVAELPVLRHCFRFSGIADMVAAVAGTRRSRMTERDIWGATCLCILAVTVPTRLRMCGRKR